METKYDLKNSIIMLYKRRVELRTRLNALIKMAPAYKLTYFDARGVTEPIRYILSYGNIDFEDVRVDYEKEWPTLKSKTPNGKLPTLEHNGKVVDQSVAIARYAARLVGLNGKDAFEDLQIDSVIDLYGDFRKKMDGLVTEKDEAKKNAMLDQNVPEFMSKFEALVKKNNGYLVNGKLTWADLYIVSMVPSLETFRSNVLEPYPNLMALRSKVEAIPRIKKWIESRPVTKF